MGRSGWRDPLRVFPASLSPSGPGAGRGSGFSSRPHWTDDGVRWVGAGGVPAGFPPSLCRRGRACRGRAMPEARGSAEAPGEGLLLGGGGRGRAEKRPGLQRGWKGGTSPETAPGVGWTPRAFLRPERPPRLGPRSPVSTSVLSGTNSSPPRRREARLEIPAHPQLWAPTAPSPGACGGRETPTGCPPLPESSPPRPGPRLGAGRCGAAGDGGAPQARSSDLGGSSGQHARGGDP
ncbi:uncharacterized protein LOC110347020 [Heterocephalus glaber]|uniref:Uncharacterized protein LOC110347020 n=1 Tax=Heterocephalus glaber TaxID=10181 RepID=A0AAX6S7Y8_HETGA|nr:uncharacterized protein LOC110347020 [Heterocephalus glaber]